MNEMSVRSQFVTLGVVVNRHFKGHTRLLYFMCGGLCDENGVLHASLSYLSRHFM
jgi:hypothetical protein